MEMKSETTASWGHHCGRGIRVARRAIGLVATVTLAVSACSAGVEDSGGTASPTSIPSTDSTTSSTSGPAPVYEERPEWAEVFEQHGVSGTIAIREVGSETTLVFDRARAEVRRIPASTFKILNSMIILETAVLPDTETLVPWDGVEREVPAWNGDHTLRSAIEVSAVWVYQAMAREVGEERMADLVASAGFGNGDTGGGIDQFWLTGDLRISPTEQLRFLEAMVTGDLPFSDEVVSSVRDILVRETGDGWAWSHKTGLALAEEPTLGWLVGTVENGDRTWVFALNVDLGPDDSGQTPSPAVREDIARAVLTQAGALP